MKVLLVGDSKDLSQTISLILKVRWPNLSLVRVIETREGIELIHKEQPDIVMLHLDSASLDGFDLISQIRGFSDVPLIVLSRSDDVMDKVKALETGADDWIALSSLPMEFIAKVNAILRRCSPSGNGRASSCLNGKLSINYATREVSVDGKPVRLTPIEYKILCQLAKNEGSVVSREKLLRGVWGPNYEADPEFLKKYIHRLRSKIEENPSAPKSIRTERGVGYIFTTSSNSPN
jgi:DNA-binding response OmpR family regulator